MNAEAQKASLNRKIRIFISVLVMMSIAAYPAGSAESESPDQGDYQEQETALDVEVMVNPDRNVNCLKTMELGDVKIAVLGSDELDVTQIQTESVSLGCEKTEESIKPLAFEYEDISTDGYTDLVMVFDSHEMIVKFDLKNCFCKEAPLKVTASRDESVGAKAITGSGTTLILPSFR
ncbi:hypothetical protein ACSAZK_02140 [Methanosarcina sp. Mfa9]|uniref:hypothetical protein n=1 Tax=Methanosarcina sp. Mfa9 TaxID=3439063 RepID=UPI003F837E9F